MSVIGKSIQRVDAVEKVTGKALYPGDINRPNQAYLKILFAGRPHARITKIDTTSAESIPGVVAVFTAKDVPVNEYGQEAIAAEAVKRIVVEYEDLPVILDPLEAMHESSSLIHPDKGSNVFCHYQIRKGDLEAGFGAADVIIEGEYHTPWQEHAYLQPEAGISYIDEEGRVTIEAAGQWTHEDQEQVAHALGLPRDQIRVIYPAIGGAFGGRIVCTSKALIDRSRSSGPERNRSLVITSDTLSS